MLAIAETIDDGSSWSQKKSVEKMLAGQPVAKTIFLIKKIQNDFVQQCISIDRIAYKTVGFYYARSFGGGTNTHSN